MRLAAGSLLWRITLLHLAAVAVLSVVLPLAVRIVLNSTAADFQHEALRRHEAEILKSLRRTPVGGWRLELRPDLETLYEGAYSGFAYAVLDDRGRVLFSSLPGRTALFPQGGAGPGPRFVQRSKGSAVYAGGDFAERIGNAPIQIQVAQDLANADVLVDDIVAAFLKRIAWFILPILAVLLWTDFVIVRRALAPVRDASAMAGTIGPATLSLRLPAERLPREIAPLGRAVNQALDRLEQGFRVQREFTADAAHELRTPLSIHRMRLSGLPDGKLRRALEGDIDRMARIVSQLLRVAELDSFVLDPDVTAELGELCSELVEYMAPIAVAQGRSLALSSAAGPVWVRADQRQLFQALRNLVENALVHTPSGSSVEVEVYEGGLIKVLDRGPGVPEADREVVFRRFWRGDRRRSGGAGLGLSIVWRIVQAHGGRIWVEDRPGGGGAFAIELRRSEAPAGPPAPAPADAWSEAAVLGAPARHT